jgi:uncharacterized protein YjiK
VVAETSFWFNFCLMNRRQFISLTGLGVVALVCGRVFGEGQEIATAKKTYSLKIDKAWRLASPNKERFDASGLILQPNGDLLTINDKGSGVYRINRSEEVDEAALELVPNWFTAKQLEKFTKEKKDHYDIEGICRDDEGRIYLCEEANRWVLRLDPKTETVERLAIDWTPVQEFFGLERNASFEGIAFGDKHLYLANERERGRIIVVDLATLKVIDNFTAGTTQPPARDVHYSDLSWHGGYLYALLREAYAVLQIDPKTKQVVAQFDFPNLELQPEHAYHRLFPVGIMEGLAVDNRYFWLVTDNNGYGRLKASDDRRPTLFRCVRPDRK